MNRVEQRNGDDCLRCCLAMSINLPYEDVPDFVAEHGEWWAREAQEWLDKCGMGLVCVGEGPLHFVPSWLPVIAIGPGPRGRRHAVIILAGGEIVDPHPSKCGIESIERLYMVVTRPTPEPPRSSE